MMRNIFWSERGRVEAPGEGGGRGGRNENTAILQTNTLSLHLQLDLPTRQLPDLSVKRPRLGRDLAQHANHLLVARGEVLLQELEVVLQRPLFDDRRRATEIGTGETGEELWVGGERGGLVGKERGEGGRRGTNVVGELHVQSSVDEVERRVALDVLGRAELTVDEALVDALVGRVEGRVGEDDLRRRDQLESGLTNERTKNEQRT